MAEVANQVITGYGVIGLNIQVAQGDNKKTLFYPKANLADFEELSTAIEGTGDWSVLGMAPVYRKDAVIAKTFIPVEGSADACPFVQCGIKRTATVGEDEVEMKTIFYPLPLSVDATKAAALKTALVNKTLAGAKVTDVYRQSTSSIG